MSMPSSSRILAKAHAGKRGFTGNAGSPNGKSFAATRCAAFTLIELLVVIAIIAILAAILFPVFARAREQARKTACLSNTKQLGLGFMMYAQDFDESLPSVWFGDGPGRSWPWVVWPGSVDWNGVFTHAVMPYIKNKQILQCPSGTTNKRWSNVNGISYGYSEYIYNFEQGFSKLADLSKTTAGPANIAVIAECYSSGIFHDWEGDGPNQANGQNDGFNRIRYHQWDPWQSNHEGTNFTYADGHSKFLPKDRIISYRRPSNWTDNRQRPVVYPGAVEP